MGNNLKELRDKIKFIKNTQQVTKAMKFVSAAKWRKTHEKVIRLRPYAHKLDELLHHLLYDLSEEDIKGVDYVHPSKKINRVCQIVMTANRGLCGAFNTNLIKAAEANINQHFLPYRSKGQLSIVCLGNKGFKYFKKYYPDCQVEHLVLDYKENVHQQSDQIAQQFLKGFKSDFYDIIDITYSKFKNAATYFPLTVRWLPVPILATAKEMGNRKPHYIFEPSPEILIKDLVPYILQHDFYEFVVESEASEHGARLTAMSMATDNAEKLLMETKLEYNKARQANITEELIEIVNGAEALRSLT